MPVSTKTIAQNTSLLYIRMFVTMAIGLFSVRIILEALGVTDYGIFNVVAGTVTMLAFLNNALASTTQRFLSYELGANNATRLKRIFSTSIAIYGLLIFIILVLAETVGFWFVNNRLIIPADRLVAANYVYQFSIVSFVFTVLAAPYNAAIIARERMGIYAYVSIGEAVGKLALIYVLLYVHTDKLILYGFMLMLISIFIFLFYFMYCRKSFEECRWTYIKDKELIREIVSFAGWGVWGAMSNIFKGQGVNILLNIFFGAIANAARGITYQIDAALNTFVQNIYTAVRPEMIKSYAAGERAQMFKLVNTATRLGYYFMFIVYVIFLLETPFILSLWLGDTPEYTVIYTRLVITSSLLFTLAQPLVMVIHATGQIARYQFISGLINIMVLPISYWGLKYTNDTTIPFKVIIGAAAVYWLFSISRCVKVAGFPIRTYAKVIIRMIAVSLVGLIPTLLIYYNFSAGIVRFGCIAMSSVMSLGAVIYVMDLDGQERVAVNRIIKSCFVN